jgi:hypothetical protein
LTGPNHSFQINHSYWRKKMKKKVLTIVSLVVVVALLATGAFAYFSTALTASAAQITTGTLGILLGTSASSDVPPTGYSDTVTPPWNLNLIVPGDEVNGCLWVKNTGNVEIVGVRWDFKDLVNLTTVKLENRLQIMNLYTSDTGTLYDWPEEFAPGGYWYAGGAYDLDNDGYITLGDMAGWSVRFSPYTYDWQNDDPNNSFLLVLDPAATGYICMDLKMINGTPTEDNPYQGAKLTYNVLVTGFNPQVGSGTP